jgi:hypothetical protein
MKYTAGELAKLIGAVVEGDASVELTGVAARNVRRRAN